VGEITELPRPLAGFLGAASRQDRGKVEKEEEGREGGSVPPLLFL